MQTNDRHIFIIGSKGIPAQYGGFETFVEELTKRKKDDRVRYHVSCMNSMEKVYFYNEAECFNINGCIGGPVGKMLQVRDALSETCRIIQTRKYRNTAVYILGCRIGPFLYYYYYKIKKLDKHNTIIVNPDGMEWRRSKWKGWQKVFLKFCERCLVKNADIIIADSREMKKIVMREFKVSERKVQYISYGADIFRAADRNNKLEEWLEKWDLQMGQYYLIVGRFVPDNNYEFIIREFIKSESRKKLVIISNIEKDGFYDRLEKNTGFLEDKRVILTGTVYDKELLMQIRRNAFAYIHGHEVGGTNPSLLEAMSCTCLNLLLDVPFNREVGEIGAVYYNKREGDLTKLIADVERYPLEQIEKLGRKAAERIEQYYNWDHIINCYENLFLGEK